MRMRESAASFLDHWTRENVHNNPGLDDLQGEVARLREKLERDATGAGVSLDDLEMEAGDLEDHLTQAYENVHDPELGFKDPA